MNLVISDLLQVIVACTLLCVWLIQPKKATPYRGGNAQNLKEEFKVYGLPEAAFYAVGALKITAALALIAGIWIRSAVFPASVLVGVLMAGAIAMHIKVSDPVKKSLPAAGLLIFCVILALLNLRS